MLVLVLLLLTVSSSVLFFMFSCRQPDNLRLQHHFRVL